MPLQALDFGTGAPRDGETLPSAFDKINDMFTEIYGDMEFGTSLVYVGPNGATNPHDSRSVYCEIEE